MGVSKLTIQIIKLVGYMATTPNTIVLYLNVLYCLSVCKGEEY